MKIKLETSLSEQSRVKKMFNDKGLNMFKQVNSTTWEYETEDKDTHERALDSLSDALDHYDIDMDNIKINE